jgi:transcriptional regulator with XRE-family HTH domain
MLCGRSPVEVHRREENAEAINRREENAAAMRNRAKRLASGDYSRTYPSEPEKSTYREEVVMPSLYHAMPEDERKAVKTRRESLGLSRASMAKAAGVTTAFIDQMEINGYGAKDKQTLVIATIEKLEMEKEMAYTQKATTEIRSIRRDNLRHILDYFGTPSSLSAAFPSLNKSSIDNIIKDRNGMGEGNARRWEVELNLPDGWFDQSRSVVPDHLVKTANNPPESFMPENRVPTAQPIKHEEEAQVKQIGMEKNSNSIAERMADENPPDEWFIEIPVDISDSGRVLKSLADAGYQRITVCRR